MKSRNDSVLEHELGILTTWITEICDIQLDSVQKKIRLISQDKKHKYPFKSPPLPLSFTLLTPWQSAFLVSHFWHSYCVKEGF